MASATIPQKPYLTGEARREVGDALRDIARNDAPTSIRHLFYRATTLFPGVIDKEGRSGERKVNQIVNKLRWDGEIEWAWIRDTSRHPVYAGGYYDAADFLARHAATYRVNAWEHVPDSVSVWCESESAMGMIDQMCAAKGVHLYPCRGHASNDFIWRAIRTMSAATREGGTAHLLYVGDWDKEGREIPLCIERKLRHEFREFVDFDFEFVRLAINEGQIAEYDLPLKPGKHSDLTVELEAMPAPTLRGIVGAEIDRHMPADHLRRLEVVEAEERAGLDLLAGMVGTQSVTAVAKVLGEYFGTSTEFPPADETEEPIF